MFQLIEIETGWRYGSSHRELDEFLNELSKDFQFEVVSVMRVGPATQPEDGSYAREKVHEYQILIRTDGEFGGGAIPRKAIEKAQVSRSYDGDF